MVLSRIIGETPAILELKEIIAKVASLDCTVLIQGETGSGKELVARTIHAVSPRRGERYVVVNSGAFSHELLSTELFGHEEQDFSGAVSIRKGLFEAANGGTVLLDEVGDTPYSMQAQLLRVLQDKVITRVGGTSEVPVDVRVLAATHHDLRDCVQAGVFREDLLYRLNVFVMRIPPLRQRLSDIELLSRYFLTKYNKAFGKSVQGLESEVLELFMNYRFPGNVRELENIIERAVIMCEDGNLTCAHLPERFHGGSVPGKVAKVSGFKTLAELEKDHILRVLEATGQNKSAAASILGINRASLWRKLKRYEEKK